MCVATESFFIKQGVHKLDIVGSLITEKSKYPRYMDKIMQNKDKISATKNMKSS